MRDARREPERTFVPLPETPEESPERARFNLGQYFKTKWHEEHLADMQKHGVEPMKSTETQKVEQPGFVFSIGWNDPRKLWQPFVMIQIWRWVVQTGWLMGSLADEACKIHCSVCEGMDHHWMPHADAAEFPLGIMVCKHCPAKRDMLESDYDG